MRLYTHKTYSTADKAKIGGILLLSTVKRHLSILMGKGVAERIEPLLDPQRRDEGKGITRYVVGFNLLTEAQEKQITNLLFPLKTDQPVAPEVARKIREDVIAILLQPFDKISNVEAEPEPVQDEYFHGVTPKGEITGELLEEVDAKLFEGHDEAVR